MSHWMCEICMYEAGEEIVDGIRVINILGEKE